MKPSALLILGMHRSGTSALTRVLNLLGAKLPPNLMPPADDQNARGFFESNDLMAIHEELLAQAGSFWSDVTALPDAWPRSPQAEAFRDRLTAYLETHFAESPLFVIKDPRVCRFAPLWIAAVERFGADCRIVIPFRNPLEVAASLRRVHDLPVSRSALLWLRHVLDAERFSRDAPRSLTTYDDLLDDWARTIEKIGRDLDLTWPNDTRRVRAEIDEFLTSQLRHNRQTFEDLKAHSQINHWIERAYEAALEGVRGNEPTMSAAFEAIRAELNEAEHAFGPLLAEAEFRSQRDRQRLAEAERQEAQAEQLQSENKELRQRLTQRGMRIDRLEADVARRLVAVNDLRAECERRERRIAELEAERERRERRIAELEAERARQDNRDRRFEDESRHATRVAERLHAEIAGRDSALQRLHHELGERQSRLEQLERRLEDCKLHSVWLDRQVADRDQRIEAIFPQLQDAARRVAELQAALEQIQASRAWKCAQVGRRLGGWAAPPGSQRRRAVRLAYRSLAVLVREGPAGLVRRARLTRAAEPPRPEAPPTVEPPLTAVLPPQPSLPPSTIAPEPAPAPVSQTEPEPIQIPEPVDPYEVWLKNNAWNEAALAEAEAALEELPRRPLFSVVMPVYNAETDWLEQAIASVQAQVYPYWELCIADDASTQSEVRWTLRRLAASDARIKVRYLEENGHISAASNAAAELAEGDYLVFLDQDDLLAPDCLLELARAAVDQDDPDILYSDDDKIDEHGRRYAPQFKPDWSPELFLSYMYITHVFCVRRERFERVGGFRTGFEGCQDYDLGLRLTDDPDIRIAHIPRVLYHWRSHARSTASSGAAKPEAFTRGVQAVQETLERRGIAGVVSRPAFAERGHLGIFQIDFPDDGPKVRILIPTKNGRALLERCVASILNQTTYRDYEVVIIDNDSDDPATLEYLDNLTSPCRVLRISNDGRPFNYARIHNEAVERTGADADYLLFLNNDTEVITPDWLSQLVGHARLPGVGCVGARLLFPDGRVQHAGVLTNLFDGLPSHAFKLLPRSENGYLSYAAVSRNYGAVTAACMLVERALFRSVGGFDEVRFAVAYNDVDLCLRLRKSGRRSVYVPRAELVHHEGATRGFGDDPAEPLAYLRTWGRKPDPYHNPNLARSHERHGIGTRRRCRRTPARRRPVRALVCCHNLNLEGAPHIIHELAEGLKARGTVHPEVYAPVEGPLAARYRAEGIPVHALDHPLRHLLIQGRDGYATGVRELADWIRARGFELVHANTLVNFYAIDAARLAGVPSIWSVHESVDFRTYFEQFGPGLTNTALRTFTHPYRVVFASRATQALFEPLAGRHNFGMIHTLLKTDPLDRLIGTTSQADARAMIGAPKDALIVTIVGTVCERKGQRDFARAALRLLDEGGRNVVFYMVGARPSPYLDSVRDLIQDREGSIRLVDETDQAFAYFRASDIAVCCSSNESFPRVTLEALAFGLPLVTTNVFGIAEQVQHERSALVFAPGDVDQLTAHLRRLLDRPDERARIARGGRLALQCLSDYDSYLDAYEALYFEAISAAAPTVSDPSRHTLAIRGAA